MQAVSDDFYFQMYYDNLPIWGFIGVLPVYIITAYLQSIIAWLLSAGLDNA